MTKKKKKGTKRQTAEKRGNKIVVKDNVELFVEEFLKNGGDVTKAALAVGNYSNLSSAAAAGSRYLSKAKKRGIVRHALESRGYGYGKMLDVALEKMEKSKKPDWWDRIMKMADYEDFVSGKAQTGGVNIQTQNIFAAHRKLSENYIDGEVEVADGEPAQDED